MLLFPSYGVANNSIELQREDPQETAGLFISPKYKSNYFKQRLRQWLLHWRRGREVRIQ